MKKIAQDKHSATFRNKDGHEIKVAISSLSPEMKKKLDQLPIHAAEGADMEEAAQSQAMPSGPQQAAGQVPFYLAPNQPAEATPVAAQSDPNIIANTALSSAGISPAPADQPSAGKDPGDLSRVADQEQTPTQAPAASPETEDTQESPAPQAAAAKPSHLPATPQEAAQKTSMYLNDEDQKWKNDLANGHIAPKTYQDLFYKNPDGSEKSTVRKVGTLFGLLLGGIGSGLTHQPNALMEMMNKEIDRDLESQKQSKTNAFNIHSLMLQQQRLAVDKMLAESQVPVNSAQAQSLRTQAAINAQTLSKIHTDNAYLQKLSDMVQNLPPGSPEAVKAQAALSAASQAVDIQHVNLKNAAAAKAALIQQLSGPQASAGNSEQDFARQNMLSGVMYGPAGAETSKFKESHRIPNIPGLTSRPVTEKDQSEILGHQKLDSGLRDLLNFTQTHTTLVPGTEAYNIGKAKALKVQSDIREGVLGTVYKAGEQPLLDSFVDSNPAGIMKNWSTIPKLKAVLDTNNRDYSTKLKSLGLTPPKAQGSGQEQPKMKQVMYKGKLYQVPVK